MYELEEKEDCTSDDQTGGRGLIEDLFVFSRVRDN